MNKLYLVGMSNIDAESIDEEETTIVLASSEEEAIKLAGEAGYSNSKAVEINMIVPRILHHEPYQEWNSF